MLLSFKNITVPLVVLVLLYSCNNTPKQEPYTPPKPQNLSGKVLAQTYCGSCHQVPEPSMLDKAIWEKGVLPNMAYRLGIDQDYFKLFANADADEMQIVLGTGIYPEHPQLAMEDWEKIKKYYLDNAPEKPIKQEAKPKVKVGLTDFVVKPLKVLGDESPRITLVKFNPESQEIYVAWRGFSNFIKKYNTKLLKTDSITVQSAVSDIVVKKESLNILSMGIMDPSDKSKGTLTQVDKTKKVSKQLDSLKRPVQMSYGDLNQDSVEDILICNFGNEIGNLTWYEGGSMKPHLLKALPGARVAYLKDMNNDKLLDIVVLMTQAREGISIFYNKGKGEFDEKGILQFSSVYGSSFISLVDFNKDGFTDILYTNGDNADLSVSLKAYHGIRIFLNDGKGAFKLGYFYPMFGASKALAADFDLDGDLDIAAISFFTSPDQKPNEGFLLLKNKGSLTFDASTIQEAKSGKWMVMDVGDMDKDGDDDIILGSFLRGGMLGLEGISFKGKSPPAVLVLENKHFK